MDPARGERRDEPGRVADEEDAIAEDARQHAAARDHPGARAARPIGALADQRRQAIEQRVDVGSAAERVPARDADLQHARALERPAEVARGEAAVDEAMKRLGVVQLAARELELDAGEELAVRAQPAEPRDLRMRPVGADEVAREERPVDDPAVLVALERGQRHAPAEDDADPHRLLDHPAHDAGRVGGEEVVARRLAAGRGAATARRRTPPGSAASGPAASSAASRSRRPRERAARWCAGARPDGACDRSRRRAGRRARLRERRRFPRSWRRRREDRIAWPAA